MKRRETSDKRQEASPRSFARLSTLVSCLLVLVSCLSLPAFGQYPWSGILTSSRAANWSIAGVWGGVPYVTTVCATVAAPTGVEATDTANINSAVSSCTGGVVMLQAGTYQVGDLQVSKSNVVLRGNGPLSTFIDFNSSSPDCATSAFCFMGSGNSETYAGSTSWTAGFAPGSTLLTLGSTSGLSSTLGNSGSVVTLDQRDDDAPVVPAPASISSVTVNTTGSSTCTYEIQAVSPWGTLEVGPSDTVTNCAVTPNNTIAWNRFAASSMTCNLYETVSGREVASGVACGGSGTASVTDTGQGSAGSPVAATVVGLTESVASATGSGTAATVTTEVPDGLAVGQGVAVVTGTVAGYESADDTSRALWTVSAVWNPNNSTWDTTSGDSYSASTEFQYLEINTGLADSGGGEIVGDNGSLLVSYGSTGTTSEGDSGVGRVCPDSADAQCTTGEVSYRDAQEVHKVVAVCTGAGTPASECQSTNQIVIGSPVVLPNWRASQNPGVWWGGAYVINDGIEDMTLDFKNQGGDGNGGLVFAGCYDCWAKNIRGLYAERNNVWVQRSAHVTIEDSYFFGDQSYASEAYGIELYNGNSTILVQNDICQHIPNCIMNGTSVDSVVAYNYAADPGYDTPDWLMPLINANHDFAFYDLFEGNDSAGINIDNVHGTAGVSTLFRNRMRGQDWVSKTNSLVALSIGAFNRGINVVGNVLGTPGAETSDIADSIEPSGYVYSLNASTEGGEYAGTTDPDVTSSLLRWGNWDASVGAVQFSSSMIPTTGSAYIGANAVPANEILPASFFLAAPPAWWETPWGFPAWPPIGPDPGVVSSWDAPASGIRDDAIPAQLCWRYTPLDTSFDTAYAVAASGSAWSSGTATVELSSSAGSNPIATYDTVSVQGFGGYDGVYEVTAVGGASGAWTFSYALASNPGSPSASGATVTDPLIRAFNAETCYPGDFSGAASSFIEGNEDEAPID